MVLNNCDISFYGTMPLQWMKLGNGVTLLTIIGIDMIFKFEAWTIWTNSFIIMT